MKAGGRQVIKYVGFYDTERNAAEHRGFAITATNKMDYVCDALRRLGYDVQIVSPSRTSAVEFHRGRTVPLVDHTALTLFPTFPWGNPLQKAFSLAAGDLLLLGHLLRETRKGETVLVYHSLGLRGVVRWARRLRGLRVILEVEEIYHEVLAYPPRTRRAERAALAAADGYLFPTAMLVERVPVGGKPFVVVHGTYRVEPDLGSRFGDGRIHAVYAGTLAPGKGAAAAVAAAAHLDSRYHVHVIGHGDDRELAAIRSQIAAVSRRTACRVTYDGSLRGEEFTRFLQGCDIGLCTQDAGASYTDSSFPSKVTTYMAHGLRVVSVRIRPVAESRVAGEVVFYEGTAPAAIAGAIERAAEPAGYDSRTLLESLDREFVAALGELLEGGRPAEARRRRRAVTPGRSRSSNPR